MDHGPLLNLLREPTVLILGAGASKPFGFPQGSELKAIVLNKLRTERPRDFSQEIIEEFLEVLAKGKHGTIDELVQKKPRYRELASRVVERTVASYEEVSQQQLFPQKDWYAEIFEVLDFDSEDDSRRKNLAFDTFNYDRSLEYFLDCNIGFSCEDHNVGRAQEELQRIRIVHAHGDIGKYSRLKYGKVTGNVWIPTSNTNDWRETEQFIAARDVVRKAKNIVFLGFGYHRYILDALFSDDSGSDKQVYGTTLAVPPPDRQQIEGYFQQSKTLRTAVLGKYNEDCKFFLTNLSTK